MDPKRRITIQEALAHPYLSEAPEVPGGEMDIKEFRKIWQERSYPSDFEKKETSLAYLKELITYEVTLSSLQTPVQATDVKTNILDPVAVEPRKEIISEATTTTVPSAVGEPSHSMWNFGHMSVPGKITTRFTAEPDRSKLRKIPSGKEGEVETDTEQRPFTDFSDAEKLNIFQQFLKYNRKLSTVRPSGAIGGSWKGDKEHDVHALHEEGKANEDLGTRRRLSLQSMFGSMMNGP